jgi:hypothetical protein
MIPSSSSSSSSSSSPRRVKHYSVSSVLFPFSVFPRKSDPSDAAEDADEAAWDKFSKVSALVYVPYEMCRGLLRICCRSGLFHASRKRKRLFPRVFCRKRKGQKKRNRKRKGPNRSGLVHALSAFRKLFFKLLEMSAKCGEKKRKGKGPNCFANSARRLQVRAHVTHTCTEICICTCICVCVYMCVYIVCESKTIMCVSVCVYTCRRLRV